MPYWFRTWWDIHGPTNDLIPLELNQVFSYFATKYRLKQEEKFFPTLMIFISKYKIPWILKWSYGISSNTRILTRIYNVKWWDKFLISKIIGHVYAEFPISPSQQMPSTSGASQTSLQIEGKSSSELKALAREILAHAAHIDDEDTKSHSSQGSSSNQVKPSSQKKSTPSQKLAWADYEDSQDPYADYDLAED